MHSHTSLSSKYELKNPKYKFEDFGEHFCTSMSKFNLPCLLSVSLWQKKKCFLEIFQIDFSLYIYKNTCTCAYVLKKRPVPNFQSIEEEEESQNKYKLQIEFPTNNWPWEVFSNIFLYFFQYVLPPTWESVFRQRWSCVHNPSRQISLYL